MMKPVDSSETSVNIYHTTRCYIPECSHLHTRRRENLKSHTVISCLQKTLVHKFLSCELISIATSRNAYKISVRNPVRKRQLGRPRRRWDDNIKIGLWKLGWKDVDWNHVVQNRNLWRAVMNTVMVHSSSIKGGEFLDKLSVLVSSQWLCSMELVSYTN
jgi:hypothetical protein